MSSQDNHGLSRRDFLISSACGAAAAGMAGPLAWAGEPKVAKPKLPYGTFGRTKYPATLVSFGAILISDKLGAKIVKAAIDAGLNLLHTSGSYTGGKSIRSIGEVFKADKTYRDKVLLCLKSFTPDKESELTGMLETLNTDHTDVLLSTMDNADPKRLDVICKAQAKLKEKGLIKHTGFVCHGDMSGVIEMVLKEKPDFFDATLLSTAPLNDKGEKRERFVKNLAGLRKQGVGILSMKSGARKAVMKGDKVFLPHVKSVLEAGVDSVLTSLDTFDQISMVRGLDLKNPNATMAEKEAAAIFRDSREGSCLMCATCAKTCPNGMPVNDLMRIRMYNDEYGWAEHARAEFAMLRPDLRDLAPRCEGCTVCSDVCPAKLASAQNVQRIVSMFA